MVEYFRTTVNGVFSLVLEYIPGEQHAIGK